MKYNDNGIVKEIVIKAGDTLPIGTIVEFDGDTIPDGYEEFETEDYGSLGTIIVDDVICKNIFDGILELGAINSYGVNFSDSNSIRSVNFINVEPSTVYTQSNVDNYKTIIYFYDSSKTFISNVGNNLSTNTFTTPSNCAYVRFCTYVSEGATNINSKFQIEKGKVATDYVPHKEFSNKQIYSTEEQVIGTWTDGKPLYRKVINGTSTSSDKDGSWVLFYNIPNLKMIHNLHGIIKTLDDLNECYVLPLTTVIEGNIAEVNFYFDTKTGNIYNKVRGGNRTWFYDKPIELTIEYTKTTD